MKTVAIVEDDILMALLLEEICRNAGYRIVGQAKDVRSALPMLERESPDILLLDFKLGGERNGLDLIDRVKRPCPDMFTIMITAWDINDIASRIEGAQPDRILRKPVHPATLTKIMNACPKPAGSVAIDPAARIDDRLRVRQR